MWMLRAEEHTRYLGTHHMDCIIRVIGQVYAVYPLPSARFDIMPTSHHDYRTRG